MEFFVDFFSIISSKFQKIFVVVLQFPLIISIFANKYINDIKEAICK